MNNSIISIVSQLDHTCAQLVQNSLPNLRMAIGLVIQSPSITYNHSVLLLPLSDLEEEILKMDLVLDDRQLELDLLCDIT